MSKEKIRFIPNSNINPLMAESFVYCINKSALKLKERFNEKLGVYHITVIHYALLFILDKKKTLSQKNLGLELSIDKASMVKFLDGLEKEKFIKRSEDAKDRRIKMITITTRGQEFLPKMIAIRKKEEEDFLKERLTSKEQKILRALIQKLTFPAK